MTFLDRNGEINGRLKAYGIAFTVIAALLGWAFTLGIVYGQVQNNASEIAMLRDAGYGERLASIESTLREIRDEMRSRRWE